MKITFIIAGNFDVRGGVKRIVEYATRLGKKGHEVIILAMEPDLPSWLPSNYYNSFSIRSFDNYSTFETDVAIATGGRAAERLARMQKTKLKVYSVVMQESLNKPTFKHGQTIDRDKYLRDCYDQKWTYIANASWLKKLSEETFGQKCELVLGGIDHDIFCPKEKKEKEFLNLLAYGRSEGWKGGQRSAQAAELADKKIGNIILISFGQSKGPITHLPIKHYRGPSPLELPDIYRSADIFLQSSYFEGFCNTAFEAMACGVPVISTEINGIEDFCLNEETALLVPPGDVQAMADAIVRLHRDKSLYNHLRDKGIDKIKEFTWDRCISHLEEIFNRGIRIS